MPTLGRLTSTTNDAKPVAISGFITQLKISPSKPPSLKRAGLRFRGTVPMGETHLNQPTQLFNWGKGQQDIYIFNSEVSTFEQRTSSFFPQQQKQEAEMAPTMRSLGTRCQTTMNR